MIKSRHIRSPSPVFFSILVSAIFTFATAVRGDVVARYGGEFMAPGGGARTLAMGGACTALSGDAWSIFRNPAGLSGMGSISLALMHSERFAGVVDYDAAAIALPRPDGVVLGVGLVRLGVNGIPFTRLEDPGAPLSEGNRVEIDKVVNDGEYAFYFAEARTFRRWRWGVAPKLIFKHIGTEYRAYGLGVDAGIGGKPLPAYPVEIGAAFKDLLGTVLAWEQTGHKEVIAPTVHLGIAATFAIPPLEAEVTPTADIAYRTEVIGGSDAAALHFGLEYTIRKVVALRIGSDDDRLTFGGGINLKPVSINYAFIGHSELGDTHRVSLDVRWERSGR